MTALEHLVKASRAFDAATALHEVLGSDLEGQELYDALADAHRQLGEILNDAAPTPTATVPAPTPDGRTCATCGQDRPLDDYPRMGKGQSRSCTSCVAERNRKTAAKARAAKAKKAARPKAAEKVKPAPAPIDLDSPEMATKSTRPPGAPVPGGPPAAAVKIPDGWRR